ncbi:MAG: 50S ribosomal protein L9 [Nitrospirae bacterium]|nr:50S ribosomal protein L9 [Nitrospirota bacterium]
MQVILVSDVEKLGRAGDIVKVAPGYARNFLLPRKFALDANPANMKWVESRKKKILEQAAAVRTDAEGLAARIATLTLVIAKQAGEEDKLYGSVTSSEIAEKIGEHGIVIDRRKIVLDEPIRRLGEYTVSVKLHADVEIPVRVNVVRAGQEASA